MEPITLSGAEEGTLLPRSLRETNENQSVESCVNINATFEIDDLKLARQLQEQERAFFMLNHMAGAESNQREPGDIFQGGEARSGVGVLVNQQVGSESTGETGSGEFEDDEAFARALMEEEQRQMMAGLIAAQFGMTGFGSEDEEGGDREEDETDEGLRSLRNSQDGDESGSVEGDVDVDRMTYEELTALGDAIGTHSRGIDQEKVEEYVTDYVFEVQTDDSGESQEDEQAHEDEQCAICRVEFEVGENLKKLPCAHYYHGECISQWLSINKQCPICSHEVGSS